MRHACFLVLRPLRSRTSEFTAEPVVDATTGSELESLAGSQHKAEEAKPSRTKTATQNDVQNKTYASAQERATEEMQNPTL